MEENIEKFELNNKMLNDFDSLMNLHLDKIKDLTISSVLNNSKFYNILGLCINLKTLQIVGDLKINTNNVITNVFNTNKIENLVFDGVKLPTLKAISKFNNLKSITLRNIKYSSVKGFLNNLEKDSIETLIFENTDFCRAPISIILEFKSIKYLEIKNCLNLRYDDYSFLAKNRYLDKVVLDSVYIPFEQLSNFIKGKSIKIVNGTLGKTTKKTLINRFLMDEDGIKILINSSKLKDLSENLNFNRIEKMVLNLNKNANLTEYMKLLKRVKKEIIVSIKDLSYLNVEDAYLLKEQLNVKKIKVVNLENNYTIDINDIYNIDNYIEIRKIIDEFTKAVILDENEQLEKVINVYKSILFSEKKEILEAGNSSKNKLENIINNVYTDFSYSELFSNCLSCIDMDVKTIKGQDNYGKTRFWNQVKIYDNWYNLDIYLDALAFNDKKNFDKKPKYFLLSDTDFYKDHKLCSTNYEHCMYSIDKKILNNYFKDDKKNLNWFINLIKKVKQIFLFNKNSSQLLPEPNENGEKIKTENFSKEELNVLNEIENLDIDEED